MIRSRSKFHISKAMRLRGAYLLMHRQFNALFEPLSLTADQFVLLSLVDEVGECTQRELADLSFADVNTVAAMVRLLERRKLVRRRPHARDGRAITVTLTKTGGRLLAKCEAASRPLHAQVAACFPAGDPTVASLARLIAAMEEHRGR